jgi:type 1 glutamine amidotransferase
MAGFKVTDELYYKQVGDEPIHVLLSAVSKDTGNEEPQAWIYELTGPDGKNARVFQTVLGHDSTTFQVPEFREILGRSAIWLSRGTERWNDL